MNVARGKPDGGRARVVCRTIEGAIDRRGDDVPTAKGGRTPVTGLGHMLLSLSRQFESNGAAALCGVPSLSRPSLLCPPPLLRRMPLQPR